MPKTPATAYGLVRWPVVDNLGLPKPPEKRKVGSSILPLTTSPASGQRVADLVKRWRVALSVVTFE
jgi:hypothetical protein